MKGEFNHKGMQSQAEKLKESVLGIVSGHVGAQNAIKAGDIAQMLGLRSDRTVREAVRQLRRDGHLIVSSVGKTPGYYIAANADEWKEFCDHNFRPRACDIFGTMAAMSETAKRVWGVGAGVVIQDIMPGF